MLERDAQRGALLRRGTFAARVVPGAAALMLLANLVPAAYAHNPNGVPPPLYTVKIPPVPGRDDGDNPIVKNKKWAIMLGKALFWDTNVGSDGVSCGSCHFHAFADARTHNQMSPGKTHLSLTATDPNGYDPTDSRGANLSNFSLTTEDFPLYYNKTPGKSDTYNTVASSGTFSGIFVSVREKGPSDDVCEPYTGVNLDQTFNVGGIHTRRVEPRNTPTFLNVVFFDRTFWDGRANHQFNGVNDLGPRDPNAFVWEVDSTGTPQKVKMLLDNSSVASLATGPGTNGEEMSCKGRTLQDIARKLMRRRALEKQEVHPEDSRLGGVHRDESGKGLKYTYQKLIRKAFSERFWSAGRNGDFGKPAYSDKTFSQMEANFPLFMGIAIQMYAETLISDKTKFDRSKIVLTTDSEYGEYVDFNGVMNEEEMKGFALFNTLHCSLCHFGPTFSSASNRTDAYDDGHTEQRLMIDRDNNVDYVPILFDKGFMNNGSVPEANDPGIGNVDKFGNPLSFSAQYVQQLLGNPAGVVDALPLARACDFVLPFNLSFTAASLIDDPVTAPGVDPCTGVKAPRAKIPTVEAAQGLQTANLSVGVPAFKVPQLYNVELTGPYFHNGGALTLHQVIDNYMHTNPGGIGGNFVNFASQNIVLANAGLPKSDRDAIVAFLKTLTDPRVKNESAPFDHPALEVYDGHVGDTQSVVEDPKRPGRAKDREVHIPAIGRKGRIAQGLEPLKPFDQILAQ